MKKLIILIIVVILGSCSKAAETRMDPISLSVISGTSLWNRITAEADYKTYSYWPGHEGIQPGQAPHGVYHQIYINRVLAGMLPIKSRTAANGTIIVKENFTNEKILDSITVMAKVKDYNPGAGDWFWAKYSPEGDVQAEGTPGGCISCHEGMEDNDYIIVRMLDTEL